MICASLISEDYTGLGHLELTFVAEKPPPAHVFEQVALMAPSWKP